MKIIQRDTYDVLNYLGDLGGLIEALTSSGFFFFTFFGEANLFTYLVNRLYKDDEQP